MQRIIQTISPIDQSIYVERELAKNSHIESSLQQAKNLQSVWKNTPLEERMAVCTKVVEYFVNNASEIGEELTWQMGRPIQYTPYEITKGFKERAEYMISIAPKALSDMQIGEDSQSGLRRFIKREALGTVFVLAPWNYPYLTSVNVIIPAILAGNTVILKHATQTPLCAERYLKAFQYAGAPEGVFQILHLNHAQAGNIIADDRIDYVAFTGSVKGGHEVRRSMGSRFVSSGMELGGKDPAYVSEDADLQFAIEQLVDGAFFNSGQSCCGIERIYVDQSRYKDFVDGFVHLTNQYVLGDPRQESTTMGPMVRKEAAQFVQKQIDKAVKQGAKTLVDPKHFEAYRPGTPYLAPQVLIDVDHSMDVMKEETFGPVVGIMSVQNEQQAIELMNDSQYGLTASIWTEDQDKAIQIGNRIDTGTFFMNRCDYLDPALAWTGVKNSGRGCTLSTLGYEALTRPKSYHLRSIK